MADQKPTQPEERIIANKIYDLDYFTGSQAFLYIGDVFVDEITGFQWRVSQGKRPVYGYASQLFDSVSKGVVLVEGTFTINFKEAGYLYLVLERYARLRNIIDTGGQIYKPSEEGEPEHAGLFSATMGDTTLSPVLRSNDNFISRANIERIIQGKATKDELKELSLSLSGNTTYATGSDKIFESLAGAFRDLIWNKQPKELDDFVRRADDNFFDWFDIYLVYGDYNNPDVNHTARKIEGVHILDTSQVVGLTGEPIQEAYSFLARNIV